MNIALMNPTTWPWVRRGSERFMNELAFYLGQRGHEVTIISAKPGPGEVIHHANYTTLCHRRLWHPLFAKAGVLEFHAFLPVALYSLLRNRYEVVHCCTFMDAYAAYLARELTGTPYVFWVNGLPPRIRYFRSITLRGAVFKRAIQKADAVIAFSAYVEAYIGQRWGRSCVRLPVPVDTNKFRFRRDKDHDRPTIICATALDDARKGVPLLMRAFDLLKNVQPRAVLQLAYPAAPELRYRLLQLVSAQWREDVQFVGEEPDALPDLFGKAAISVLPSLWEPFGMVILESMATGTPVVGTRDGAIPELISNRDVGRLFDPGVPDVAEPTNVEGLTGALLECLELSRKPGTAERCRAHSETFNWQVWGPRYEALYQQLVEQARPVAVGTHA